MSVTLFQRSNSHAPHPQTTVKIQSAQVHRSGLRPHRQKKRTTSTNTVPKPDDGNRTESLPSYVCSTNHTAKRQCRNSDPPLRMVCALEAGQTAAIDYAEVEPVDDDIIEKTLPHIKYQQIHDMDSRARPPVNTSPASTVSPTLSRCGFYHSYRF